jgi:ankyrin repeat protein
LDANQYLRPRWPIAAIQVTEELNPANEGNSHERTYAEHLLYRNRLSLGSSQILPWQVQPSRLGHRKAILFFSIGRLGARKTPVLVYDGSLNRTGMSGYRKSVGQKDVNPSIRGFYSANCRIVSLGFALILALFAGTISIAPQPRVVSPISADEFAQAVVAHRAALIDLYLSEHLNPNSRTTKDRPLIVAAALQQDWETVRRLLNAGASSDLADANGTTTMMVAATHGNIDIMRELIGGITSVDLPDRNGYAALHHAVAARQTKAIEFLLPFMPNLGSRGSDLLALALTTGDFRIADSLLERMPLLDRWSPGTRRVLEQAIAAGDHTTVRLLLKKHITPPTSDNSNVPMLADAIANEDTARFRALLSCGADPNTILPDQPDDNFLAQLKSNRLRYYIEGEKGVTVLMLAAGVGNVDFVRALLDAGADRKRATTRYKMLPLYLAAQSGHWRCAQVLLGSGPPPEQLRIEISLASQKVALIKDGVPIFNTICSTGRDGRYATQAGDYVITDKDRHHFSTIYKVEMPYFMRLSCLDFGMHEGYVPNYPASHGCIRLPGDAARRFFEELPIGTLVSVK